MKGQNFQSVYLHKLGGVPIAIGMKVETAIAKAGEARLPERMRGQGSEFIIQLPV